MYGSGHVKDVDIRWFNNFSKKQKRGYKSTDFSVLPSCKTTKSYFASK